MAPETIGELHQIEADSEHDREPDPAHEHLPLGWLAGSLTDEGGSLEQAALVEQHQLGD